MGARELLADLVSAGLAVERDGDRLIVRPASKLTGAWRSRLRAAKPELLTFLRDAERTTEELVAGAMLACEAWGDDPEAREEMRRQCLAIPTYLRGDLLAHLRHTYSSSVSRRQSQRDTQERQADSRD